MRTTLTIDDDILAATRAIAERQHRTLGDVVSELARKALQQPAGTRGRNGVPLLPVSAICLAWPSPMRDSLRLLTGV